MRAFEFLTEAKKAKLKQPNPVAKHMNTFNKASVVPDKKKDAKAGKVKHKGRMDEAKQVGREFNHLEDLVFTNPNDGAVRAIKIIKDMEQDSSDVAVKWDGNPTVYWGREDDGTFRLVGKNNWGKEEGKSSSPEELEKFILSRGKGEDWRPKFAKDMAGLWDIFEKATPPDFRGYVYGDLLYHPGKPYSGSDGSISFTPNQTTYNVRADSEIGRRIAKSKVAVTAHSTYEYFGDKSGEPIENVEQFSGNPDLVVIGQTYVSKRPAVDADNLGKIEELANKYQASIAKFFEPVKGLSDLQEIFYRFVNNMSRAKKLDSLNTESFENWVANEGKISQGKQSKIQDKIETNPGVIDGIFQLVSEIMKAKNEIIDELDKSQADVTATTGSKPGGEGYVKTRDKVKLVPRDRWTPFRSE
jgi:hypothetical protein